MNSNIKIIGINDSLPPKITFISNLSFGYNTPYLGLYKDYDVMLKDAKLKAAKLGGNIVKITSYTPYQYNFNNKEIILHKMKVKVYHTDQNLGLKSEILENSKPIKSVTQKAVLNFYMFYQGGAKKNVYFNNQLITELKSKSKFIYETSLFGKNEVKCGKEGIPFLLDISKGHHYFLKCNISLKLIKNIPYIEKKDSLIGSSEFNSL